MSKKKKKRRRTKSQINRNSLNCHHILWQARHWNQGYAKRLREHPYMKEMLPQFSLHNEIHRAVNDIPMPSGSLCKKAYETIENLLLSGLISLDDPFDARINILLSVWGGEEQCRDTVRSLKHERSIVRFYNSEHGTSF